MGRKREKICKIRSRDRGEQMKNIIIIQARMGSTRLPGKVLKKLAEKDVLSYVVDRCKEIKNVDEVIVATTTLQQDDAIELWCKHHDVAYFRGSEKNVLERYVLAAEQYNPDYVIRITSDCPFLDIDMANEMIECANEKQVDIIDLEQTVPRGLAAEVISYSALKRIYNQKNLEERHFEHVTYYAYEYKDAFTRELYKPKKSIAFPALRLTLDTEEDYQLILKVSEQFKGTLTPSYEIIRYLNEHPEVAKINAHIEQKVVE